jgi:hypothetical protein
MTSPAKLTLYCEHGAFSPILGKYKKAGLVELFHFPRDPNSQSKRRFKMGTPSHLPWADMTLPWTEYIHSWDNYRGSEHYDSILSIVGRQSKCDAFHVDSAYKTGCAALITRDCRDIVANRVALERLLGIRIFHPDRDKTELERFIVERTASR